MAYRNTKLLTAMISIVAVYLAVIAFKGPPADSHTPNGLSAYARAYLLYP